jgi:hypothetical protein
VLLCALLGVVLVHAVSAQIPGMPGSAANAALGLGVSENKLGSVLFYNYYTSDISSASVNTRFSITNANPTQDIAVHLFFVDGSTCNIADNFICLTRNQTASFLASDIDPNVTGYVVAVAVDAQGLPAGFNYLAGDELVVTGTGHRFGLAAVAAARRDGNFVSPVNSDGISATMFFNGVQYDFLPQTMILDNFPSQTAGLGTSAGDTRLYVYTPHSDLATGGSDSPSGTLFFLIRDDQENTFSGQLSYVCYLSSDKQRITSVRTSPNINTIVPAGQSGWASFSSFGTRKVLCNTTGTTTTLNNLPLMGATATRTGSFLGGHNLRYATTFTQGYSITIPLITPSCGDTVTLPTSGSTLPSCGTP